MPNSFRARLVNPHLGVYYSIVGSLIVALFLVLLILSQLGTADVVVRLAVLLVPAALYVAIAALSTTSDGLEFFAGGRRVPAVCSGLVLAMTAIGGTGVVAWTGLFLINGFDAWCMAIGVTIGFVVMAVAVTPFVRKAGSYTMPSFLARRFQSRLLRLTAASVMIVPMLLILMAELTVLFRVSDLLLPSQPIIILTHAALVLALVAGAGGNRSVGWVGTAQAITLLIALVAVAGLIGVLMTNFPVSQLSYGPVLRGIGRLEVSQVVPIVKAPLFEFKLAGAGFEQLLRRFAEPYGSVGPAGFALASLTVAGGVAAGPWLMPRNGTTTGVYEARKSLGWAIFFAGLIVLSLSALAVFMRDAIMQDLVGRTAQDVPQWFKELLQLGWARAKPGSSALQMSDLAFRRDTVLFAVPKVMGQPSTMFYLLIAGTLAACLASAAATTYAIATLLAEDVVGGLRWEPPTDGLRLWLARLMVGVTVVIGFSFVGLINADPVRLFLWAMGLSAASVMPVVILSIWWKRLTHLGAVAAMLTGFGFAIAAILSAAAGLLPMPSVLVAVFGVVPAVAVAVAVSKTSPIPPKDVLEQVRDIRLPGGETVYDREMRLLRLQQHKQQRRG
ncbi:MAG: sodium:solute symporter [Hyphomicrobiaceae bacterium]|nr:sodium:solute symporter [Hyphomicrobiaceae bacterium]